VREREEEAKERRGKWRDRRCEVQSGVHEVDLSAVAVDIL
jgi:hypothetical protein